MEEVTRQLTFRLPETLIERVEDCLTRMQQKSGINLTRADVVRMLLTHALDETACDVKRLFAPSSPSSSRDRRKARSRS